MEKQAGVRFYSNFSLFIFGSLLMIPIILIYQLDGFDNRIFFIIPLFACFWLFWKLQQELTALFSTLKQAETQLVQSEKMAGLGRLVAGVAHELNNPLNYLSMQPPLIERKSSEIQLLLEAYQLYETILPEEDRKLLQDLKQSVHAEELPFFLSKISKNLEEGTSRSKHIVENLRIFARAESIGENWDWVDLRQSLESTISILLPTHGRRITVHREYAEIPKIWCRPPRVSQVLMNLLANAMEAIEVSGDVWVETQVRGGLVEVTIRDNGPGMSREVQSHIFQPFFTTKAAGIGTGLGLSIVSGIIKEHQGEIKVETELGKGTTFRVLLPIRASGSSSELVAKRAGFFSFS